MMMMHRKWCYETGGHRSPFGGQGRQLAASQQGALAQDSFVRRRDEQPLLYRALNMSRMGTGPPLVVTEGITPFHFSTAVLCTSIFRNSSN